MATTEPIDRIAELYTLLHPEAAGATVWVRWRSASSESPAGYVCDVEGTSAEGHEAGPEIGGEDVHPLPSTALLQLKLELETRLDLRVRALTAAQKARG